MKAIIQFKKIGILFFLMTMVTTQLYSADPVKLVVSFWGGPVKAKAFQQSADAFTKENPNVTIELINIPGSNYTTKLIAMVASGTAPDVININPDLTIALEGQLVELSDKMQDLGYFDKKRGLLPGWFNMLSSDGHYSSGEKLYKAPLGTGTTILAYNKRLFDEAGLSYPTPDWTWEGDFMNAVKKLSEPKNQWGINGNNARFIYPALMASYGGGMFDLKNLKFTGDSPESIYALNLLQDMIYKDKVHPTPSEQQAFGGQVGMFESGAAAMYFLNTFEMPSIYDMKDDWDIQFIPKGPKGSVSTIYGGMLSVMDSSNNQEHGWKFINLLNGPIGQGFFSISSGFNNPPLQSVANTEAFRKGPKGAPENNWIRVDSSVNNVVMPFPILPNAGRIMTILNDQLKLIWMNKISPEKAMSEARVKIQPLLDDGF